MEIIFYFRDDRARSTWKVRNVNHVFRAKKFTPWFIFLQVKQVDLSRIPLLALALATSSPEDYPLASLEEDK